MWRRSFIDGGAHCMVPALWNQLDTPEAALLRFASRNGIICMLDVYSYTNYVSPFDLRTYTHARRVIRATSTARRKYVPSSQSEIARKNKSFPRAKLAR